MRPEVLVIALFVVSLAGCLEAEPLDPDAVANGQDDAIEPSNQTANETIPLEPELPDPIHLGTVPFGDEALTCPCLPLNISLEEDAPADGWLDVRIRWDGTKVGDINATLTLPNGSTLWGDRGFDATRLKVPQASAGTYQLDLRGHGEVSIEAFARSASAPKVDSGLVLPNIVVLVPEQIGFGDCDSVERNEQGAKRCLRLGNAIGNTGDGPVEVFLTYDQAAMAFGNKLFDGVQGQFIQRVYNSDGTPIDSVVGHAEFHEATSHLHWHYDGFADFKLYAVDPVTGIRGSEAATGHKTGFCFLDWGPMPEEETTQEAGGRAAQDCLVPGLNAALSFGSENTLDAVDGWSMGISAGWFDFYWEGLTDQYVEASDVSDGTYELVSIADPDDWLQEVDERDNAASVLIQIRGDDVQVLERRGWYNIPEGTNNL